MSKSTHLSGTGTSTLPSWRITLRTTKPWKVLLMKNSMAAYPRTILISNPPIRSKCPPKRRMSRHSLTKSMRSTREPLKKILRFFTNTTVAMGTMTGKPKLTHSMSGLHFFCLTSSTKPSQKQPSFTLFAGSGQINSSKSFRNPNTSMGELALTKHTAFT